jgi:DNA-binding MarR family transcriptional regulator/GNAT superfamily N-acetyltransferase
MNAVAIRQVRSFNRTVAEGIGAIADRFLGRARPMSEARVLWEIGADGADVHALADRLGLDPPAVNRVLRSLERQRLVRIEHGGAAHRRARRAMLTRSGLAERTELDRRSDAVARRILEPLSEHQRESLLAAVAEVERLLHASMVRFAIEDPASDDARWCLAQYFGELTARFDAGFDPARSISADAHELRRPAGALFVARLRGDPVGCGALKLHGTAAAELKRMWIAPEARGLGIGSRLLNELECHARDAGAVSVQLETNRALVEAIALYRRSGYLEVEPFNDEPYAHHWFEKHLYPRV